MKAVLSALCAVLRWMIVAAFVALPLLAQGNAAFPRFSVTAGAYDASFATDVRVDPNGTPISLERDLALEQKKRSNDFAVRWRPLERHELAASYVSASRNGFRAINEEIVFNGRTYPVNAQATTTFDTKKWEATYTYWLSRSQRAGFGLTLGAAGISIDASVFAHSADQSLTITQSASTSVPVALGGAQARLAFTDRIIGEASAAALPHVKIDVYSGRATTASARLEFRLIHNLGIGAGYNYFNIDGTVTDPNFGGRLRMTAKGPEAFVRIAF
jgi:hypothetical protein